MPTTSSRALSSREKVLRAAKALFAARGFHGTSTRDVARRARVNEITIFRLFKNKQDLYLEVLDGVSAGVSHWFDAVLGSALEPQQTFLAFAERLRELLDPGLVRLLCFAAVEKPELMKKRFRSCLISVDTKLEAHLRHAIENGRLRNLDRMSAYQVRDYLIDIGTPANYAAAQREWPGVVSHELPLV